MNTAVLVIDVQQGLCEGEGKAHDCAGLIARINDVTRRARQAQAPVVFIQHESGAGYLEHGSPAWQLAQGLEVQPSDIRVRKTTPDSFLRTDLEALLKEKQIQQLVVCGMHTEFCVDTTTRRALALGYPVTLVADAHSSAGNAALTPQQVIAHHNATLTHISSFGPVVTAVPAAELTMAADGTPQKPMTAIGSSVEIVPYDTEWPAKFEAERVLIEAALAPWLAGGIEHIGSTAVPGLWAKPVIDIMAPVLSLEASRPALEMAARTGYVYYPYQPDLMHWFCKPSPHTRTHHLHLVPVDSALWQDRLCFRDTLRSDTALAARYAELKLRLAQQFSGDREAYTDAKTPFIRHVLSARNTC